MPQARDLWINEDFRPPLMFANDGVRRIEVSPKDVFVESTISSTRNPSKIISSDAAKILQENKINFTLGSTKAGFVISHKDAMRFYDLLPKEIRGMTAEQEATLTRLRNETQRVISPEKTAVKTWVSKVLAEMWEAELNAQRGLNEVGDAFGTGIWPPF